MHTKRIIVAIIGILTGIIIYFAFGNFSLPNNFILMLIRNYLPDFLWSFSFYLIVSIIISNMSKNYILLSAIYVFIFGIIFEFLQFFKIVNGTFDWADIIVYFIAIIIAVLTDVKKWRENK